MSTLPNFSATAATKRLTAAASVTSKASAKNFGVVLLSDLLRGSLQGLLVAGAHGDAATLGGEGLGGGAADPLTGSGYESDTIFQAQIHRRRNYKRSNPPTFTMRLRESAWRN